jgi:two-component system response regulator YesN
MKTGSPTERKNRETEPKARTPAGRTGLLVEAMRAWVLENYREPVGLGDLAAEMRMNASYLSSLFSRATGGTLHRMLEEVRLRIAREMLLDPRIRVGEVARAAGYASADAFRHAFKAHEGVSPGCWRMRR